MIAAGADVRVVECDAATNFRLASDQMRCARAPGGAALTMKVWIGFVLSTPYSCQSLAQYGKQNMAANPNASWRRILPAVLCITGAGITTVSTGFAQEGSADGAVVTPDVEVSAYRLPTLLSETSQGVSVVTRDEIEARNASSAVQLLRELPGLYVDQVGGPGGVASIHIRGSDPEHVLVLIDGVRVNDPMLSRGGSYDFSSLDLADVERVEIIRGSGSAIYGADAMGGVVNIITRRGETEGVTGSVGVEGGGQDYGRGTASVSGRSGKPTSV